MKTKALFLCLAISALTLTNCGKKGCIDSDGENFCSECKKDDGSCTYKGSYVVWTNGLQTGESINVKLNGALQGNIGVNFNSAPPCGQNGALTINQELGKNKTQGFSYHAELDSAGTITRTWDVTLNFVANKCIALQLQ